MGFFGSLFGQTDAEIADAEFAGGYDPNDTRNRGVEQQGQTFQRQNQLADSLQGTIAGQGPSVAQAQLQAQGAENERALAGQAAGARGVNKVQAQRDAMMAGVEQRSRTNQAAAQLRAQEVAAAQGQLGGVLGTQQQAGLTQQQIASGESVAQMNAQQQVNMARFQQEQANQGAFSNFIQGAAGAVGGAMMSDIRAKEDIRPMDRGSGNALIDTIEGLIRRREMATPEGSREALAPVDPYRYRYTDEAAGRIGEDTGMRTGVMAQDLERSPYMRDAVIDTPEGKAIDKDRALGSTMAATAGLDKRLRRAGL